MRNEKCLLLSIIFIFVAGCITPNMQNSNNGNISPKNFLTHVPTVAFVSDARPELGKSLNKLTGDFSQIIPQSPTRRVDAIVMIGDMEPIDTGPVNTEAAYSASTARQIPVFYVLGNHELNNIYDLPAAKVKFAKYYYDPSPGPEGSRNTTYSFNVGDMHIVVINEYWDGDSNNRCDWFVPNGGLNEDDSCFKYGINDGGFIPDKLLDWISNDLDKNTKKWTIAVGHEPLFPYRRHVGDSIDENLTNRDKLENLFVSKNVTAFISGHTHISNLETIDDIYHANTGLIGDNVGEGDNFATIIYASANDTYFVLDKKYENPTWNNPGIEELFRKS